MAILMTHDATKPLTMRERALALRLHFKRVRNAEKGYTRQLLGVARQVGLIVRGLPRNPPALVETLEKYADVIAPWARQVATGMVEEVARRDANVETDDCGRTCRSCDAANDCRSSRGNKKYPARRRDSRLQSCDCSTRWRYS
jgi:hypothetical protein